MFSNLKAKKRITQLLIAIVVVALTATGSALLLDDFVQEAKAADYNVSDATSWKTAVTSGNSTVNITLTQNATISLGGKLEPIPSGVTVNLNMNGATLQWYDVGTGNSNIISTSYPFADSYWGMITNNGTLNVQGTGTISQYHIRTDNSNGSGQDNYGMKSAAIVNKGTLTLGSGITVKNYAGQANESDDAYQDMFIYSHGIYNTGTVTSSGTIKAGSLGMGVIGGSTNSFASAYSYGIFGGNVTVNGGNIYSEAKSGFTENYWTSGSNGNQVWNFAVGVYSNNATIYGNSSITTKATSWRDQSGDYNIWKNGGNMSWGVGVMYSGTSYPVIGADVSINASFQFAADEQTISFPEYETAVASWTRYAKSEPGTSGRRAYAVAGVSKAQNDAMWGGQTGETRPDGGAVFGMNTDGNASSTLYRSELAAYNGLSDTVSVAGQSQSGGGTNETKTSYLSMGAPGSGAGGQYMVYYRYRDINKNVISASTTPNTAINSRVVFSPTSGVFTADGTALTKTSGGDVVNPNYYEYLGTYYINKTDGQYGTGVDCSKPNSAAVTTTGTSFTSLTMNAKNSYIIWVDYMAKPASNIKVVAANAGTSIGTGSTYTSFETTYTGKALVPGTDFALGIIDINQDDKSSANNVNDYTMVTDSYDISLSGSGKIQPIYEYSTDGTTYHNGLPKNVGTYTIKMTVPSDADINKAGSGNRNGDTFYLDCTIKQATPTVNGSKTQSGTYGDTVAQLIPTGDYSVTGQNGEEMTGSWAYSGYAATDCPEVGSGSKTIRLTWTPSGDCATNYKSAFVDVTVSIAKRNVTVAPDASTVTYGAAAPNYVLNYTNLAVCDEANKATWLANTTFEVSANGSTWQDYSSTLIPGEYQLRIKSFGGDTANNNFTTSGTSKLTINKAPLYYTAAVADRDYNGTASVDVTLTYNAGAVNSDNYAAVLTTTGTVSSGNAGENKTVTVVTDGLDFTNNDKYYIFIQNNPTVNIRKVTPTATAETYSYTYDANRDLSHIELKGTASVAGNWSWKDASIVPTVDVTKYTAIFTPTDTVNYNTIEVPVTINVAKAEVKVSVAEKTVSYGDPTPALPLVYTGFTGTDTIDTVATTGTVGAETTYSMGKSVGTYPITVTMTDYEADNYFFTAVSSNVIVEKKNVTITAPSGTVTYGDADIEFDVNDLTVADDSLYGTDTLATIHQQANFVVTTAYERGYGVGTYEVTVSASETTNYTFTFVNGSITVNKAVLTVTANNCETYYGEQAPALEYTITGYLFDNDADAVTGAPALSTSYNRNNGDGAGEYAITITHGTLAHPNYTFKLVNGTLTVKKVTLDTTDKSAIAYITHDEAYSEAEFDMDSNPFDITGTFALKNTDAIADYTVTDGYDASLGKFVIVTGIFTPTDSDNYNSVELDIYLVIEPHAITGAPVITGTAMENSTITASVAGMAPSATDSYTYTWYVGEAQAGTGTTYTVKTADIGKAIYVEVKAIEAKGYTGSAKSASVTAVESFAQLAGVAQLDITGANATYTYDDNAHGVTVTVKDEYKGLVSDNITVYYNGATSEPYKAGTYIVTIDVGTPNVTGNRDDYYGPVSGLEIGTLTIEKATVTATFTVENKIYDGTRKVNNYNVLVNGVIEPNDVRLDVSAISIAYAKANAGEHKVEISGIKLVGNDVANYKLEIVETSATIEKATLTATAAGVTRPYNGSAVVDVTFTNISGYASIDSSATVYFAQAAANATSPDAGKQGLMNIRYELGGSSKDNYVVEISNIGSATVTITKATPNVTAPVISGLVYDANRTLGNIVLSNYYVPDSNGYWQFDDTSVVPAVKKTAYAATYISTNNNYADLKTTITVNVTPKEVVLTAVDTKVSYGKAASYSVKAEGFTGADSLATMGGTQPTYVCEYYTGRDIGTYSIAINHNLDSNGNYTFKTVGGTLTVVPADLYVSATASNRDYNGNTGVEVKFTIVSGKYSSDDVSLSTTTANGTASSANAGTRTVTYTAPTLTGSKASNYNLVLTPASGILTVTINKIDPENYIFPTSATIEFGYDLTHAMFTDDAQGDGDFAYANGKAIVPSALGEYYYDVVFTPTDSVNYNTITKSVKVTVTKCTVSYVVGISGTAQVGQKLSTSITGLSSKAQEYIKYQWYRVSPEGQTIAISGATGSTYIATEADEGYTLACVTYFDVEMFVFADGIVTDIGNHSGIMGETNGTIQEENLTFWQRLIKWIESIIEALTGITFIMG